jgi:hypothetical protein
MAKMVNAQVREKVAAALADYGDLDELKAKAAEAEKSRSLLDRIEEKLAASEKRAAAAERETLLRGVAEELGISMRLAAKLEGNTRAELLADGRETMEDLGIKPKGKTTSETAAGDGDAESGGDDEQDETPQDEIETPVTREPVRRPGRPREQLRSAAPVTPVTPEETDPLKLAALIPRR